ncbi:Ribosome biogenesis regulatory protein [Entamoeba marina]
MQPSTDTKRSFELDVGNLMATDVADVDPTSFQTSPWNYISDLALSSTQALVNDIYAREDVSDHSDPTLGKIVTLDAPMMQFPREKPIPKPKEPTKWEIFAKRKGIKSNKKREGKVFNEDIKEWVPRFGKGSSKQIEKKMNNFIVEDKVGMKSDPWEGVDPKKAKELAKPKKGKKKPSIIGRNGYMNKKDALKLLKTAQRSSASMGVFTLKA